MHNTTSTNQPTIRQLRFPTDEAGDTSYLTFSDEDPNAEVMIACLTMLYGEPVEINTDGQPL